MLIQFLPNAFVGTGLAAAIAALDHGPLGAGAIDAAAVHIATLAALSDRFSVVVQDTGALSTA